MFLFINMWKLWESCTKAILIFNFEVKRLSLALGMKHNIKHGLILKKLIGRHYIMHHLAISPVVSSLCLCYSFMWICYVHYFPLSKFIPSV